jgi:hypothetical protein
VIGQAEEVQDGQGDEALLAMDADEATDEAHDGGEKRL